MALILFSTTDLAGSRERELTRLLASIGRNVQNGADIRLYLLLQNCPPTSLARLREQAPPCCRLVAISDRCPLSAARNQLIEAALAEATPGYDDVVGFPDDDCWYPDHTGTSLSRLFNVLPDLEVMICRVARQPDDAPVATEEVRQAAVSDIVRLTTSNSLFIRGTTFLRVGGFAPDLGVGTVNGSAEDTDYAIRALLAAGRAGLVDRALIAHPEPDLTSAAKYYRGALIVLARHAGQRPALMFEFVRKLLVGGYFVSRRKLSARHLLDAFAAAARNFLINTPQPPHAGLKVRG